ncbi:MAG: pyridoxal phosphate-dependent aminotransferase [bacterium]
MATPNRISREKLPLTVWNLIEAEAQRKIKEGDSVSLVQIGDTFLPMLNILKEPVEDEDKLFPLINRYSDTFGEPPFREKVLEKVQIKNHLPANNIGCIQITSGATGGLFCAFRRLVEPGGEVLTLAPYWSILRQVAEASGVRLVEVPFYERLAENPDEDLFSLLDPYRTERTQGIYLNTPSNPTGLILTREQLQSLVEYASRYDLWIFSDEAYEDFIWEGIEHISIGSVSGAWERTLSVYTFSKSLGISGLRVGYVVAPEWVISQINRAVVGSTYQPSRLAQLYAYRGLLRLEGAVNILRQAYYPMYRWVKENLEIKSLPSKGGFYFFVHLGKDWGKLSAMEQVRRMLDGGVALAPGEYFGKNYREWARLCFTVLPLEEIQVCVERLNKLRGC